MGASGGVGHSRSVLVLGALDMLPVLGERRCMSQSYRCFLAAALTLLRKTGLVTGWLAV